MHGSLPLPKTGLVAPTVSRGKSWQKTTGYSVDVDQLETGVASPFAVVESYLGNLVREALDREYPGHMWHVETSVTQGIMQVKLISFSNWGKAIHLRNKTPPEIVKMAVHQGGEWLERYGFPRKGLDVDDYRKNMALWQPTWTRNLKPPD